MPRCTHTVCSHNEHFIRWQRRVRFGVRTRYFQVSYKKHNNVAKYMFIHLGNVVMKAQHVCILGPRRWGVLDEQSSSGSTCLLVGPSYILSQNRWRFCQCMYLLSLGGSWNIHVVRQTHIHSIGESIFCAVRRHNVIASKVVANQPCKLVSRWRKQCGRTQTQNSRIIPRNVTIPSDVQMCLYGQSKFVAKYIRSHRAVSQHAPSNPFVTTLY